MDSAARLRGRLRAARHSLRELRDNPHAEVRRIARRRQSCDLCCREIRPGRPLLSWLWGGEEGSVGEVTVHPDCLRVYDSWPNAEAEHWGHETWSDIAYGHHGLTRTELLAEIDACEDPDVAATLRRVAAERVEHGWDDEPTG